jgi:hypothetical protein
VTVNALRQAKASGEICMVWNCPATHPQHAIVWKCPAGHRDVNWYCRPCAEEMAMIVGRGPGRLVCQEPVAWKNGVVLWCGGFLAPVGEVPGSEAPGYGAMSASMTRPSGTMNST